MARAVVGTGPGIPLLTGPFPLSETESNRMLIVGGVTVVVLVVAMTGAAVYFLSKCQVKSLGPVHAQALGQSGVGGKQAGLFTAVHGTYCKDGGFSDCFGLPGPCVPG